MYITRINFSVAIVCMTIDPEDNVTSGGNTFLVDNHERSFESYFRGYLGLGKYEEEQCPDDDDDDMEEVD